MPGSICRMESGAFGGSPAEPDIPEAVLPTGTSIPIESQPAQPVWADTPEALPPTETPRPTESYPPQPIWYSPVITSSPAHIPSSSNSFPASGSAHTRLQVTTGWAQSSGLYWIDFGSGKPRCLYTTAGTHHPTGLFRILFLQRAVRQPLADDDAANQTVISQADLILNPNAVSYCTAYVSWEGDEIAAFAARTDGVWSTYLWRPDGSLPIRVGPALNGADHPPGRRTESNLPILNDYRYPTTADCK